MVVKVSVCDNCANHENNNLNLISEEHLSRDEKKATMLGLPLTTDEIVNLPMDEFNERLSKHDLSETQLSLIRDIRRRGKNKASNFLPDVLAVQLAFTRNNFLRNIFTIF